MDEVSVPASVEKFLDLHYATTKRAWSRELGFHQVDCAPRMVEGMGRDFMRKLRHKKHGQNEEWHIRQNKDYLEDQEREDRKLRNIQKKSRRINRG